MHIVPKLVKEGQVLRASVEHAIEHRAVMAAQLPQLAIDLGCRRERQRRLIREKTIETVNREIDRCLMPRRQTVDELLDRLGAMSISVIDGLCPRHPPPQTSAPSGGWH